MMTDDFLEYLRLERNYSMSTVECYGRSLRDLDEYFGRLDSSLSWTTIDSDIVRDWLGKLMEGGASPSTVNLKLSAVKAFYRWALRRGHVKADPVSLIQGPKRRRPLPNFVRDKEMDKLLDPLNWGDDYESFLARTLLIVFYETGIRLAELVGLDDKDVNLTNAELKVTGKRRKQRIVPFGEEVVRTVEEYRAKRDATVAEKQSEAFFLDHKGRRITRSQVEHRVRQALEAVPMLGKHSPHVLRHTFATSMLNHGAGLESVKKLLGHSSLATTEIYTHTTFEQLKRAYSEAHPRA